MIKRTLRFGAAALLAIVAFAACGSDAGDGGLDVVVSTTILGDIVENIVGDSATVEVLMPVGADPHDYQPSSRQVAAISEADLVVVNGLGLEESLVEVLAAASADGANILEIAPLLDPLPFAAGHDHHEEDGDHEEDADHEEDEDHEEEADHEEDEDHEEGGLDPHVWLDPVRMVDAVDLIVARLTEVDSSVDWAVTAAEYKDEIMLADWELQALLGTIPVDSRKLVSNHDSLGYLAARYGFEVIGVVIPGGSTLAEPSSAELADLVHAVEDEGVRAIFAETTQPDVLAEAVAAEVGQDVEIVTLFTGSLGAPGSGAETYLGMLRVNADRIAGALSG